MTSSGFAIPPDQNASHMRSTLAFSSPVIIGVRLPSLAPAYLESAIRGSSPATQWRKIGPQTDPVEGNPNASERRKGLQQQTFLQVGETGFEPATARPPAGCATRLRHSPICRLAERATGIEPALEAWKASVQPQHFARGDGADDSRGSGRCQARGRRSLVGPEPSSSSGGDD